MGHTWTTGEILDGFDLRPFVDDACSDEAFAIYQGYVAAKLFTALAGEDAELDALDEGYRAGDVFPEALRDAWDDVESFVYTAAEAGESFKDYSDDELDDIGTDLALSVEGHGTGLWDGSWEHLEPYRAGIYSDTWLEGCHFGD